LWDFEKNSKNRALAVARARRPASTGVIAVRMYRILEFSQIQCTRTAMIPVHAECLARVIVGGGGSDYEPPFLV
jgi:hypothetical protein